MYLRLFLVVLSSLLIISCADGNEEIYSLREENKLLRANTQNLEIIVSDFLATNHASDAAVQSTLDSVLAQINKAESDIETLIGDYKKNSDALLEQIIAQSLKIQDQQILLDEQQSVINTQTTSITRIESVLKQVEESLELQKSSNSNLNEKLKAQQEVSTDLEKEIAAQKDQDRKLSKQIESLPVNTCKIEDATKGVREITFKVEVNGLYNSSTGSAFYIGESDFITNQHVVKNNSYVFLKQGAVQHTATVITTDAAKDLALLRISDSSNIGEAIILTPVDDKSVGMQIGVTGFPKGLGSTPSVTFGVISRVFVEDSVEQIQTDAAISPGSSGGPVFDSCGKLLGVITSKLVGSSVEGLGFAVSSDTLTEFLAGAKARGVR